MEEIGARPTGQKKGIPDFSQSEPEFLIFYMNRHDWAVVVCLVGGGQEINTGEAGISEWINALEARFPNWHVCVSPRISLPEYASDTDVAAFLTSQRVRADEHLHLALAGHAVTVRVSSGVFSPGALDKGTAVREFMRAAGPKSLVLFAGDSENDCATWGNLGP